MSASYRLLLPLLSLLCAGLLAGCGGSNGKDATDVAADLAVPDTLSEDRVEPLDVEEEVAPDVANQANLFPHNPERDEWQMERVTLTNIDTADGRLSGPFAKAFNCLNEDGGWMREYEVPLLGLVHAQLCNITQTVLPDPDGSYLSVELPGDILDPNDPFAELMMFYHVNYIHDFYKGVLGYDGMDFPLEAYVNLQAYIEVENNFLEIPEGWVTFDNAMFIPGESFAELEEMAEVLIEEYLGIEDDLALPFQNDAIFFLQGESLDFAYDADVVYHEYSHAVVGGDRLFGTRLDEFGPDVAPMAINEAYADYFACSVMGDPIMAEFALVSLGAGRDLTEFAKCPDDYAGEEHKDGLMYSTALWEIREALGAADADRIIFNALLTFTLETGFEEAALATIAEAALLDPPQDEVVSGLFARHGLLGCNGRLRPYADTTAAEFPEFLPGTQTTGVPAFAEAAPGYLQHAFEVPEGTVAVRLEVAAESSGLMSMLGGFMGGGGEISLALALKHDGAITYAFEPEYAHTETAVVPFVENDEGLFVARFGGNCLEPGEHVFQFLNLSADALTIRSTALTFESENPLEEPNYDCKPVVDPCADADCELTCSVDEDCPEGHFCSFTEDGCCSACAVQPEE